MLQVDNRTPFTATLAVFADPRGIETAYAVVKAAFHVGADGVVPTPKPLPLLAGDVFWGDPQTTGLRAAGELTLCKPATDIVLLGSAVARREGERAMPVSLRVGPVTSALLVFGPRHWQRRGAQWVPSDPEPFERVPLRWELAFGGMERLANGQAAKEFEPRNPVGRGFIGTHETEFADRPLPQIEHPEQRLQAAGERPPPVGWAPIAPFWSPRREYAGTYDAVWQKGRAPYLPTDFDERFLQTAPPGLVAPGHLVGGESVQVAGCLPNGQALAFDLPRCTIGTRFNFRGDEIDVTPRLDSVIIEPDQRRVQLVWRAALEVDKHLLKLTALRVDCAEYPLDEYLGAALRRTA